MFRTVPNGMQSRAAIWCISLTRSFLGADAISIMRSFQSAAATLAVIDDTAASPSYVIKALFMAVQTLLQFAFRNLRRETRGMT